MILFSIPVHEKPEVVLNQVENFSFFNPGCLFVIHTSAWMPAEELAAMKQALSGFPNVHFNDTSLWSGYADGTQMKMHVVNYLYAKNLGLSFDYFCLHASNDMFVRPGLETYMRAYDAGGYFNELHADDTGWVHMVRARKDRILRSTMRKFGITKVIGGQVEGSFYSKHIMDTVIDRVMKHAYYEIPGIYAHGTTKAGSKFFAKKYIRAALNRFNKGMLYAKEEIYFPTLSQDLVKRRALYNYCYVNWLENLNVTTADVENIRKTDFSKLTYMQHIGLDPTELNFFAVKRIDRNINDPMRKYITALQH